MFTIGKTRSMLYKTAKILGDVSAVSGGPDKIMKRIVRKKAGKLTASGLSKSMYKLFK